MNSNLDPQFELRSSKIHGIGCFTLKSFRQGQFICHYEGERITPDEAFRREQLKRSSCICHINSTLAIDGSFGGNGTHYLNHSCQPNCSLVFGKNKIMIHALRNIKTGEELTADYYYEIYTDEQKCRCRTAVCREFLSGTARFNFILRQFFTNEW